MDEINKIRKDHFTNEKTKNEIAKKFNRSWATVDSYLNKSPEELKSSGSRPNRISHQKTEIVKEFIQQHLHEEIDKKVRPKQRFTSFFLFKKARDKGIFKGSERYFRMIVNEQRVLFHQLKNPPKTFLDLDFHLGEYLQFDHGPVEVELEGHRFESYLFCASIPGAAIRFCQVYLTKAQESWGDFHERSFNFFGGIFPKTIYDNDSVLKVPSTGEKTFFSLELEEHYQLELIFCNKASGWEKGAVENAVGTCRRNFLPGVPSFTSLQELNDFLKNKCQEELDNGVHYKTSVPLKEMMKEIKGKLPPLPQAFAWGVWEDLPVNSRQYVTYKDHKYSVPERYVGFKVRAFISPFEVRIYDEDTIIATHPRVFIEGKDSSLLDHFFDQLSRKPRAIRFAKVMGEQNFPDYLKEIRERLQRKFASSVADVEFIKILRERRNCSESDFEASIRLGISYGGITHPAIASFISQMQLSQTTLQCPVDLLPSNCPTGMEILFDLSPYNNLELEGGLL